MGIFEEVLYFQAMYNIKTEKQTINSLSLCQFDAGILAEGKGSHLFQIFFVTHDCNSLFCFIRNIPSLSFSSRIVCFYLVRSLEKVDFLKNLRILSCFVQFKSVLFNLLCVLDLFAECRQSTLVSDFFPPWWFEC